MADNEQPYPTEVEVLDETDSQIEALNRASLNQQIVTAKEYPRSVDESLTEAKTLATKNQEVAQSCFYTLPRKGGTIRGPTVRLAEIMNYCWTNLRAEADVLGREDRFVKAMAMAVDLERNTAVRKRVKRRIVDSEGNRYNEDMIQQTENAAVSIAFRNCVFTIIPRPFVDQVYDAAREASVGKDKSVDERRELAMQYFKEQGVSEDQIYDLLEVGGKEDMDLQDIIDLRGLATALKEGTTTLDIVFGETQAHSQKTARVNEWAQGRHREDEPDEEEMDDTEDTLIPPPEEDEDDGEDHAPADRADEVPQEPEEQEEQASLVPEVAAQFNVDPDEVIRARDWVAELHITSEEEKDLKDYLSEIEPPVSEGRLRFLKLALSCEKRNDKRKGAIRRLESKLEELEQGDTKGGEDEPPEQADTASQDEPEDEPDEPEDEFSVTHALSLLDETRDYLGLKTARVRGAFNRYGETKDVLDAIDRHLQAVINGDEQLAGFTPDLELKVPELEEELEGDD